MANTTANGRAIRLSSGRIALEVPRSNTLVSDVVLHDGGEMTEAEWQEYCRLMVERKCQN